MVALIRMLVMRMGKAVLVMPFAVLLVTRLLVVFVMATMQMRVRRGRRCPPAPTTTGKYL